MALSVLDARRMTGLLAAVSLVLFAVRIFAATRVGFGDSEALYACYALSPQPAYLDHPGLVGLFARAIGHGTAPSPLDGSAGQLTSAVRVTACPTLADAGDACTVVVDGSSG